MHYIVSKLQNKEPDQYFEQVYRPTIRATKSRYIIKNYMQIETMMTWSFPDNLFKTDTMIEKQTEERDLRACYAYKILLSESPSWLTQCTHHSVFLMIRAA